jgi:hypothetical protein
VICLAGALDVGPDGDRLRKGDALHFAADMPHG